MRPVGILVVELDHVVEHRVCAVVRALRQRTEDVIGKVVPVALEVPVVVVRVRVIAGLQRGQIVAVDAAAVAHEHVADGFAVGEPLQCFFVHGFS